MREALSQLETYARGAWRFRWLAIAAAWAVAVAGWGMVFMLSDTYESRARVYVDAETVLKPLLAGLAVGTDVMNRVNMMSTVLLGRPNLEKVARDTDLYLRADNREELEALVTSLSRRISLTPGAGDSTYSITFADSDPQMAHRIVQTLLNTFVEDTLGLKREDATGAQRFLEAQLRQYEVRLAEAEQRLADFKKKNVGLMPGEQGDYYTRLQTAMTKLATLRADLRLATERHNELVKQLEGEEPVFGLDPGDKSSQAYSPTDAKIAEYKTKLDALLLQYTEKHPEIIALKETIAQLEHRRDREAASRPKPRSGGSALDQNPVYQNMKIALSKTDVEVAQTRAGIAEQEREIAGLRGKTDTIPEVEAQLARLNRDYEVNRTQYNALLQRLESARLSDEAEQSTEEIKFRVIEPPTVPLKPVGPNRPLLLSGVMLLSLGAAIGLAILLNELRPVFSSRASLREITGLPVLGSISLVRELGEQVPLLQRPFLSYAASAMLLVAYGGTLVYAWAAHSLAP